MERNEAPIGASRTTQGAAESEQTDPGPSLSCVGRRRTEANPNRIATGRSWLLHGRARHRIRPRKRYGLVFRKEELERADAGGGRNCGGDRTGFHIVAPFTKVGRT